MVSQISLTTISATSLISYMNSQLQTASLSLASSSTSQQTASTTGTAAGGTSTNAQNNPPWNSTNTATKQARDAQIMAMTNFLNTSDVPHSAGSTTATKTAQDNQKLFSLYTALNNLSYLAGMSTRAGVTSGQQAGYNTRFQQGLTQVENYISSTNFNELTLQLGKTQSSVTSSVSVPFPPFSYQGATIVSDANLSTALPNVSSQQSFNIAVQKGGTVTNVAINLANVSGPLTLDNIIAYVNKQLAAAGSSSTLSRVMTQGSINDPTKASYGIAVTEAPGESLTFSSAGATPALYLAGSSGSSLSTSTVSGSQTYTTAANQQGRLVKLSNLSTSAAPQSGFNATLSPTSGTSTTTASAIDSNGNIYTIGTATGSFGNELIQGSQDVVLSKYDSAGNLQWTKLLGSSGNANAYSLAIDSNNNVIIAGSSTANLTPSGIANGSADTFVAKYDTNGNQQWVQQIPTLAANGANSVSVDASGNIYIGGQVNGTIGSGQTSAGGQDAYVAKLDSNGNIQYEQQFGTSGSDAVGATAVGPNGSLYVASVQNGQAVLSKYANGDATKPPVWTENLGALGTGGSIGGIALANGKVYLSGTTSSTNLTSGGTATVVGSPSGGLDAFVASFTNSGSSVTADTLTYVGTSGTDTAGGLTVDSAGNVYLSGTTTGTFNGQNRNVQGTQNAFVAQLSGTGTINWVQQYGGASGTSTGSSVVLDPTGSSVLDALGLPRGTIDINQSVDLTSASTLRPGDSFQIQITRNGATSTQTITIGTGETLQSLVDKINNAMVFAGSASVTYANGGNALKISVNKGVSAKLIAGPQNFDALARLGIAAGTISNSTTSKSTSSSSNSATSAPPVFGLGLTGSTLDISTSTGAGVAKAMLFNAMNEITTAYRQINAPPASAGSVAPTQNQGPVSTSLTNQISSYQLALSLLR